MTGIKGVFFIYKHTMSINPTIVIRSFYRFMVGLVIVILFSETSLKSQNLLYNGDFEYPVTDELSMCINGTATLPGWGFEPAVSLINHTRLFPFSNFQCLLLPANLEQKARISQVFTMEQPGNINISFALAASRMESGKLRVMVDQKLLDTREYSEFWTPTETRLTDHMKWVEFSVPVVFLDAGEHRLEFIQEECKPVFDNQGDKRDMIEGFLIDNVIVRSSLEKNYTGIPSLDDISGQVVDSKTLACYPAVGNFYGNVKSSKCLGGFETQFLFGSKLNRAAGVLRIGETIVFSRQSKWYPYQIVNKSGINGVEFTSTMRLVFEEKAVLMKIVLENKAESEAAFPLSMQLVPGTLVSGTGKAFPQATIAYAGNFYVFTFTDAPDSVISNAGNHEACWPVVLEPGETKEISYVMSIGSDKNSTVSDSERWAKSFPNTFSEAKEAWEDRWEDVFTPNNKSYSGHLPTFETNNRSLYELYYLSVVSFLQTQQNNVYPTLDIAFGSNNEWANNQAYFWEISQFADIYALLDPKGMKTLIEMCLKVDINKGNAIDYRNGNIVNHWYAVNDYALFKTIDSYLRINKDFDFLKEQYEGTTVLEHLYRLATAWEKRYNKKTGLADYGSNPWSFFETNPDYIHFVPAMNAQNVWMLRSMAGYDDIYGNPDRSAALREKADFFSANVRSLYVPGQGVWKVKYPNGKTIVSRHSYDFLTIGTTLKDDLSTQMKKEMIQFVERELLTETNFMRAMSMDDHAALNTDRSDHGPAGCYIGWPALTVQAIADMGEFEKAKTILSGFRSAFIESGMGQAIEFLVPVGSNKATTRLGARAGASFLLSGSDYANTIIDGLMGYKPSINGELIPYMSGENRYFTGKLKNLRHGIQSYTFEAGSEGVKMYFE